MARVNEDTVEQAAIEWFRGLGYAYRHGGVIAPGEAAAEREDYREVVLVGRLRAALARINPGVPDRVLDDVVGRVRRTESQKVELNNHAFHRMLTEGVAVSFREGGKARHEIVWLVDYREVGNNDWLVVNQFTVEDRDPLSGQKTNRRPDLVVFVNGLPLAVFELKNATDEKATVFEAFNQFATYKAQIAPLFTYNAALVVSDGLDARMGTITAGWEWFKPWRTVDGERLDPHGLQLQTLIEGVFARETFLDVVRHFTVFEVDGAQVVKKMAAYHQYHAVNKAVAQTVRATGSNGKVGVVWHTQGSGKSLSMLFYAGKVIQHEAMENPTLVVLTDRNDLDDQLFGTFAVGQELLRQEPQQAENRDHLRELLRVASGGVVFTTIQKFTPDAGSEYPLLSERRNIVFIADEAHRSQYGFEARMVRDGEITYGFAKYVRDALPNASFIGFTGTPVETTDANTPQVFGDYIDIYDIQRAVEDGATVPIYYQGRLARLHIKEQMGDSIDPTFEEITEGEEQDLKEKLKSRWSQLEAMVGTDDRLRQVAEDIVAHFEERQTALEGKGMIVTMSRRIAVGLYDQLIALRPDWHSDRDEAGVLKVVMTGSASDPQAYQPHIRSKPRRKDLAERFKDPDDALKLVIVRDMWLTGFDAPPLHTMYIDKPMRSHGLMQAIARVNRVFRDKPGGLVVDYLGIATDLQEAIQEYTVQGSGRPAAPQEEAVALMLTEFENVQRLFRGYDYSLFHTGSPAERLGIIPNAMEHILSLDRDDAKKYYLETVSKLSKAFALAMPHEDALAIRGEVAFFQAVRAALVKATVSGSGATQADMDSAVKQLVSEAVASEEVIDIFRTAGIQAPDISILSDEFLEDVQHMPQKNLALELLRKLLNDEIRSRSRTNVVQARSFRDLMEKTIHRYQNRTIDAAEVVTELIEMAKDLREANQRGEELGLNDDELAFYDALAESESAREVMGDKQLAVIALELVKAVKANVTIDWTVKEGAQAGMRVIVKRILRRFGYPPDLQDKATQTVLEQAEALAAVWAVAT